MTNKISLKVLMQLLVVLAGSFLLWNINIILPNISVYPPRNPGGRIASGPAPAFIIAAPGVQYKKNFIGEFWFGKHYRFLWETPVKVPVFDLHESHHPLTLKQRGGGMQTIRFTLADSADNEYILRSVDKDPIQVLPSFLWPTVAGSFVRDQVSATDPYATLLVSSLSQKAEIPAHPATLVFILPDDPDFRRLGYRSGGFFYLSKKEAELRAFQKPQEKLTGVFSSEEMLNILKKDAGKATVDSLLYLRCRLFDFLIGDWDRHPGQWDWAGFSYGDHTVFRPIPKDRDQALGYYQDGVFPYLLSRNFGIRKITSFSEEYEDVEGFAMNGKELDDLILQHVSPTMLDEQVTWLINSLNDRALQDAVRLYPPEVGTARPEQVFHVLKKRRQRLPEGAILLKQIIQER